MTIRLLPHGPDSEDEPQFRVARCQNVSGAYLQQGQRLSSLVSRRKRNRDGRVEGSEDVGQSEDSSCSCFAEQAPSDRMQAPRPIPTVFALSRELIFLRKKFCALRQCAANVACSQLGDDVGGFALEGATRLFGLSLSQLTPIPSAT